MSEEEIQVRMMLPMLIETIRCLEENIVDTPNEADTALIYGIGFPPFLGGALKYVDARGLDTICALADKYAHLGKLYEPTEKMRKMATSGQKFTDNTEEIIMKEVVMLMPSVPQWGNQKAVILEMFVLKISQHP